MSARSRLHAPDPLAEVPFWRTRAFLFGTVAVAAIALTVLTIWLVRVNNRQQMERRLDDDPQLADIKNSLVAQINSGKPAQAHARVPVALWLGKVKEFTVSVPTSGAPPVTLVKLEEASLLAGSRAKNDGSDTVTISGKQYAFGGPRPRPGETWLISVWRDSDGNNAIHSATRAEKK